jgi:NAD-dependent deacetylase
MKESFPPENQLKGAEAATSECGLFFTAGTSAVVYPAASLIYTAKQQGTYIIGINIEETKVTSIADYSLTGKAGYQLNRILNEIKADPELPAIIS